MYELSVEEHFTISVISNIHWYKVLLLGITMITWMEEVTSHQTKNGQHSTVNIYYCSLSLSWPQVQMVCFKSRFIASAVGGAHLSFPYIPLFNVSSHMTTCRVLDYNELPKVSITKCIEVTWAISTCRLRCRASRVQYNGKNSKVMHAFFIKVKRQYADVYKVL